MNIAKQRGSAFLNYFYYDERGDVYFQQNEWTDTALNMQWCNNTLFPGVGKSDQEKDIFADNVSFHQTREFHEACRNKISLTVYMLPDKERQNTE